MMKLAHAPCKGDYSSHLLCCDVKAFLPSLPPSFLLLRCREDIIKKPTCAPPVLLPVRISLENLDLHRVFHQSSGIDFAL